MLSTLTELPSSSESTSARNYETIRTVMRQVKLRANRSVDFEEVIIAQLMSKERRDNCVEQLNGRAEWTLGVKVFKQVLSERE